jgi:hypothetical protein
MPISGKAGFKILGESEIGAKLTTLAKKSAKRPSITGK